MQRPLPANPKRHHPASVVAALLLPLLTSAPLLSAQTPSIVGSWHGTSTCVDKVHFPGCNTEEVVFEVRARPGTADTVDLSGDKVVNGARLPMGDFVLARGADGSWSGFFRNPQVSNRLELSVAGTTMTGRMVEVPSQRAVRRESLERVAGS